ncbi:MAG: TetR family transcriptional regulator [Actinomycetota bacterium]
MPYHHGNLRAELLARAAQVVADQGVEGLSLRSLARDLGVSHGAPAKHFRDRADLLAALAAEGVAVAEQRMAAAAVEAGSDPQARLAAMGRAYVRFAVDEPSLYGTVNHPEVCRVTPESVTRLLAGWIDAIGGSAPSEGRYETATFVARMVGAAEVAADPGWRELLGIEDVTDELIDALLAA